MEKIEKLEDIIQDYIGPNKTIADAKVANLTAPGENYMSDIVKIDVVLNKENGDKEDLHLVAKLVTNVEFMGSTSKLSQNEFLFYKEVVPTIKDFYERRGLRAPTFFPEFIGGRLNLTGGPEPDEHCVIILENLQQKGYKNVDRHVGFDLETAKLVLNDIATFHASPVAIKLLEPDIFEKKIMANCVSMTPPAKPSPIGQGPPEEHLSFLGLPVFRLLLDYLKEDDRYPHLVLRYESFINKMEDQLKNHPEEMFNKNPAEPFATLAHQDLWINNTMQIHDNGRPISNKIVDFQGCQYGSLAQDLIFFLFSSVKLSTLREHFNSLLMHYHKNFSDVLNQFACYESRFGYDRFLEEVKSCGERAIGQCIFMIILVIFAKKGEAFDPLKLTNYTKDDLPQHAVDKVVMLLLEASKREWI